MEDFKREVAKEYLPLLTAEERMEGISAAAIIKSLLTDVRLKKVTVEEIKVYLEQLESNPSKTDKA